MEHVWEKNTLARATSSPLDCRLRYRPLALLVQTNRLHVARTWANVSLHCVDAGTQNAMHIDTETHIHANTGVYFTQVQIHV